MTTCQFVKFPNVRPEQLANLMKLIGSPENTGRLTITRLRVYPGDYFEDTKQGGDYTYRHISLLKTEESKEMDGCLTVSMRINSHFEPTEASMPEDFRIKPGQNLVWGVVHVGPLHVPRSLILAMYDCLGLFPK